jgi:amino acid permease
VATFNLVATIVGGGVLSLPLAFAKAGIGLATIMMIVSAFITEFGLYILCSCARRTGAASYMGIVRHAFGAGAEICMTITLWLFLSGVLCAYCVLLKGIFAPMAKDLILNTDFSSLINVNINVDGEHFGSSVLLCILILVSPLMLRRSLYALRNICYVGFTSVCVIVISIGIRAFQKNFRNDVDVDVNLDVGVVTKPELKYFTDNVGDFLFSFPIIVLSFLCVFNIIEVQSSLINPTRPRVRYVLRTSIVMSLLLFQAFGLAGYFYAFNDCKGNIFLNFDASDPLMNVGRLGMGLTLMFGTPIVTLPCREAFLSIFPQVRQWLGNQSGEKRGISSEAEAGAEAEMLLKPSLQETGHSYASVTTTDHDIECSNSDDVKEDEVSEDVGSLDTSQKIIHFLATLTIASLAYVGAVAVPGVEVVWSILGSTIAFLIGFIMPSACYLKIRGRKGWTRTNVGAFCLLVVSSIFTVLCTAQTVRRL